MDLSKYKKTLVKYPRIYKILTLIYHKFLVWRSLRYSIIKIYGVGILKKDIIGNNNQIIIAKGTKYDKLTIRIRGNDNNLTIDENCNFGPNCSIWMEGNGITIRIGKDSTFTQYCHLNAQENLSKIIIGEDCMFSNNIIVRTSDSHPIYDISTEKRINNPMPVIIGNHVWIAPNTKIMKGAEIPDGCVIGSDTTISKIFDKQNSLILGRPARIVKSNIIWTRDRLF